MRRLPLVLLTFLTLPLTAAPAAAPRQLTDFDAILDALRTGRAVRVVVDYGRCELIADNEPQTAPQAIGGMPVDVWEYFAAGSIGNDRAFLAFSHGSLIQHARRGMVINHVKFRVHDDGRVAIGARYLDPATHEVTMFQNLFTEIADGDRGAAAFYLID